MVCWDDILFDSVVVLRGGLLLCGVDLVVVFV